MHRCSYAHEFTSLPDEVRETLEGESYYSFMGQIPESGSGRDPGVPLDRATSAPTVPGPLASTTRRLLAAASFASYTRGNHALSERVSHEAVNWCSTRWASLESDDPLAKEEEALRDFTAAPTLEAAREMLPPETRPSLRSFADEVLQEEGTKVAGLTPSRARAEARARIALVARKWREALDSERDAFQTRELGRALGSFVRELASSIPLLARAQTVVQDLFGTDAAMWDITRGQWTETQWDALVDYGETLDQMPELENLAEILGRSKVCTETRETVKVIRKVTYRPTGLGKSEVTGVNFGDDLTSLLASEVALLSDPLTEDLFYAKLAHKELLQLDYRRERLVRHSTERLVPSQEEVLIPRGPLVLCVDTSGSMLGDPEIVAKAMTLALAKRLQTDLRDVYVIAFSTAVKTLTLHAKEMNLAGLCEFLSGSFHGGTDLRPALAETLRVLQSEAFENADVVVISDFKVPKIADRFIDNIKAQQRRGTLFHSLTVARSPVKDPLHIFDNSWLFNISEGTRGIHPDTLRFLG